ncbi:MAG: hypothetical protein HDS25_01020 [Bacteroides sp.]|nr:hypothetical protein [Bacteroides sp.]
MKRQLEPFIRIFKINGCKFQLIKVESGRWEIRMPMVYQDMMIADELSQIYGFDVDRVERHKSDSQSIIAFNTGFCDGTVCSEVAKILESVLRTA